MCAIPQRARSAWGAGRLGRCIGSGAGVALSRLAVGDLATESFAESGVVCAGRVEAGPTPQTR